MTENLQTDPSDTNEFILNAALNKEPVFESYKKLCEIQKKKINYVDFEWKYFQFYHGNQDFNTEKSPLTFSKLPMDVLEKVVGNFPLVERLVVRKVSPNLQNLVDLMEVHCSSVGFVFGDTSAKIDLRNVFISYRKVGHGDCEVAANRNPVKTFTNSNFEKMMVADASTFLKNPKLKIDFLKCDVNGDKSFLEFLEFLKSLDFQLNVRSIFFKTKKNAFSSILQFLKPKALETIMFSTKQVTTDQFNEIAETEQWKMARKLFWNGLLEGFRLEKMLHFKEITLDGFEFSDQNLIAVRDILFKSAHLELCYLTSRFYFSIGSEFNAENDEVTVDRILGQDSAYDVETGRFSIPNSRDYFQLDFENCGHEFKLTIYRHSPNE